LDSPLCVAFDMTFPSRNVGGSGVYANRLLEALRRRGDVTITEARGPSRSNLPATTRWLVGGARRAIRTLRPALVHCPIYVTPWSIPVPFVVTAHDAAARRYPADHPLEWRLYDRLALPGRLRAAARVISVSEFARREVIEAYGLRPDRVVAIHHGLDPRYFEPVEAGPDARGNMLFPGAPIGRKNLESVLHCMAGADPASELGRAALDITGARSDAFPEHVRLIEGLGLAGRVHWLGKVPLEDMPRLFAGASLVVYPSFYEGFGFPPLEAMAVGTPVVASNQASLPEVLGDAALQVEPADRRALSGALETVLSRPGVREGLRERGRRRARGFSWDRCAERTSELYREVAREAGAA
jgi:alpha-1,3-rhamnosyl/mannosyltransferase